MVSDMMSLFRSFRTILCMCPHCEAIQRLSDLQIRYAGKAGRTWLDEFDSDQRSIEAKEANFQEKEEALREEARERGRRQVPVMLRNLIHSELTRQPFDPYDIKALLHPVDFVVFDGMNESPVIKEIAFLSRKADNRVLAELRGSIKSAISKGSYNWQVARVDVDGNVTYGVK